MRFIPSCIAALLVCCSGAAAQSKPPLGPFPIPPIGPKAAPPTSKRKPPDAVPPTSGTKPPVSAGSALTKQSQLLAGTMVTLEGCLEMDADKEGRHYTIASSTDVNVPRVALEENADLAHHIKQRVKLVGTSKAAPASDGKPSATIVKVDKLEVLATDCSAAK